MHGSLALAHLQRPELHGSSVEHPHRISLSTSVGAAGTSLGTEIGTSDLVGSSLLHPNLQGSISGGSLDKVDFQIQA